MNSEPIKDLGEGIGKGIGKGTLEWGENLVKSFLISTLEFKGMTEASCADTCKLYNKQCVTAVQTKFTTEWSSKGSVNNANHPCETKSPDFKQNELICLCI